MDERFFMHFEEVDLCKRLAEAGGEIWFWPEARVQMARTHQSFLGASKIGDPLDVVDDSRAARRPRKGVRLLGGRHGLAPRSRNSL
jgi:hypothetical protein